MNDRIGSSCWYFYRDKWVMGKLRAWSTESSPTGSLRPVGVVEDDKSLRCWTIPAWDICFASIPPGEVAK